MSFIIEKLETDVLIVGGGLAGCMAAINASESGLSVTIVEKSNTKRSGCAGSGIDHLWSYIPSVHEKMGWSLENLVEEHFIAYGKFVRKDLVRLTASTMYDRMLDLEKIGLKFRFEDSKAPGKFRLVYQFHSQPSTFNFEGRDIKRKLTAEVLRKNIRVINRVMITDLLTEEGQVCGAAGVSTREEKIYVIKAKTVVMSTSGRISRLSKGSTGNTFNRRHSATGTSGDSKVAALRAGAEIINMEFYGQRPDGFRNYTMHGGAPGSTYQPCARVVNAQGEVVVPRIKFYDWNSLGSKPPQSEEELLEVNETRKQRKMVVIKSIKETKGPLYMDFAEGTDEEVEYVKWSMSHEGKTWILLKHLEENGVNLKRDKMECGTTDVEIAGSSASGVWVDSNCESGVKGLFIAGDEIGGAPWVCGPGAIATGWHAGGQAAERAGEIEHRVGNESEVLEGLLNRCQTITARQDGENFLDIEYYLQDIMDDTFPEGVTNDDLLSRGIKEMEDLMNSNRMSAKNPHELMRCLEVENLMESGRLVMLTAHERKESRSTLKKADYPEQDDQNWFNFLAARQNGNKIEFRKVPINEV